MKKLIALILVAGMLLLVGCKKDVPQGDNPAADNVKPEDNPNQPFGYTEADLAKIILDDKARGITLDMSDNDAQRDLLLGLRYNPEEKNTEASIVKYVLTIGGNEMLVCEGDEVIYDGGDKYPVGPALLSYLNSLFIGEVGSLDATMGENAKVYNSSGQVAEVTDIPAFLEDLNGLGVIELWEITDFTFGTEDYRIEMGHDSIKIYGNFIVIGETAYAVVEGDFGFLSDLDFSSSSGGFLPWI